MGHDLALRNHPLLYVILTVWQYFKVFLGQLTVSFAVIVAVMLINIH